MKITLFCMLLAFALMCGCINPPETTTTTTKVGPPYGTTTTLLKCSVDEDCIPAEPLVGVQYYCYKGSCNRRSLGNPASQKCTEDGGEVKIVNAVQGQRGLCLFPDGSVCEEWAYFRGNCSKGACMRKCDKIGTKSEGWYDCHDRLLYWETCSDSAGFINVSEVLFNCTGYSAGGMCTMEYNPVCAKVPQTDGTFAWKTYGNACSACTTATEKVLGYKLGECA